MGNRNLSICLAVSLAIFPACGKRLTIAEELARIDPADRQQLDRLLAGTGLTAAQLVASGAGDLGYNQRSFSCGQGRLVELRLTGVPIPHLEAVTKLTALRALWLEDAAISSLPDLGSLTDLRSLKAPRNQIEDLTPLAKLSALTELDLSRNRVQELAPLTGLPGLTAIDVRGNPTLAIPNPLPPNWNLQADASRHAELALASHPGNWVAATPSRRGFAHKSFIGSNSHAVEGGLEEFDGSVSVNTIPGANGASGASAHLRISVEKGRVRAYLQYFPPSGAFVRKQDGYLFAEATPGKPGEVDGVLEYGGGSGNRQTYRVVFESMDGDAHGLYYRITSQKPPDGN